MKITNAKKPNRHLWLLEPLEALPGCEVRPMFGARSCYFNGLIVLVLADKDEPWRGVLVPVERENHASLIAQFPVLAPHSVLPKWLYLPESTPSFERDAQALVDRIRQLDPRFGVVPGRKRKKAEKGKKARKG